ncbi:MAG: putative recombinase [Firmicutes bacterium]|nr:putative recombinase [Bacillota bacterium]
MHEERPIRGDRVGIYIRWSTEDQGEGTTLAVQREACQSYIHSQGWTPSDALTFVDDGISGGTVDRPALTRLRAAVRAGEVDCVVVYKLDRLSRSVVDMVKLVLEEWDGRCYLKSAREPLDTVTQAGRLFFYQLVAFAEWERSVIRERTFAGKLRRAREGRNPGITAAYGYRLGPGAALVVAPDEAPVVQLIYRLYLSGLGCTQVTRRLAELGHPSPSGGLWSTGQISRMLNNPIYTGQLVYGKQVTIRGRRVKSGQPLVVREGAAPPIIDMATFTAVQQAKARRPGVGRSGAPSGRTLASQSLLTGLLRCRCGRACRASISAGYRYYCCGGAPGCVAGRIRQEVLDELVAGALLERYNGSEIRARLAAEAERQRRECETTLAAAERQLARLREKQSRLGRLLLDQTLTPAEYRQLKSGLDREMSVINDRIVRYEAAPKARSALEPIDSFTILTPQERKQLLRHLLREIRVYRDRPGANLDVEILWHK